MENVDALKQHDAHVVLRNNRRVIAKRKGDVLLYYYNIICTATKMIKNMNLTIMHT